MLVRVGRAVVGYYPFMLRPFKDGEEEVAWAEVQAAQERVFDGATPMGAYAMGVMGLYSCRRCGDLTVDPVRHQC